jgi:hypothetical protein
VPEVKENKNQSDKKNSKSISAKCVYYIGILTCICCRRMNFDPSVREWEAAELVEECVRF